MIPKNGIRFSDQIMLKEKIARLTRNGTVCSKRP